MSRKKIVLEYWVCIVGAANKKDLKRGADSSMRMAVENAFVKTTGSPHDICMSGWGCKKDKADILNSIWSMGKDDPLYISIKAMLEGSGRI